MARSSLIALARRLAIVGLALPLAGCISFGPKPPASLLTLHATSGLSAGPARTGDSAHALAVSIPTVEPGLATQRIMVQAGAGSVAYVKEGLWASSPAILMRNLLAETVQAKTGRIVPDPRLITVQPDTRLTGHLDAFGLDAASHAAIVTYDGTIQRSGSDQIETRRFTASVPVAREDAATVGTAINQAANQVAGEVADWIGTR